MSFMPKRTKFRKQQKGQHAGLSKAANFIEFDQPFTLFNTKIFSEVKYTVNAVPSGHVVYQQTVKIPCVLGITDVFDADARRIEAMKCSIRENVTHMMRDINSKF